MTSSQPLRQLREEDAAQVAARGYEMRRESLTMEIEFDELPSGGDFGELELRTYRDDDHDATRRFGVWQNEP